MIKFDKFPNTLISSFFLLFYRKMQKMLSLETSKGILERARLSSHRRRTGFLWGNLIKTHSADEWRGWNTDECRGGARVMFSRELNVIVSRFATHRRPWRICIYSSVATPSEIFIAFRSTGSGKQSGNLSRRLFRRCGTKLHSMVNGRKWRCCGPCVVIHCQPPPPPQSVHCKHFVSGPSVNCIA